MTGTLAAATGAQGGTTGLSKVQGSTTGSLAADTGAQGDHREGLAQEGCEDPLLEVLQLLRQHRGGTLETRAGATRQ